MILDYLAKAHTITGNYHAELLTKLRKAIKDKRRGILTAGIDHLISTLSHVAVGAVQAAGFKTVNHSLYSSDIVPSDYLFANLKKHLRE